MACAVHKWWHKFTGN
uniref:Uncharacterized protein n=1 Tax=Vitis vinifera TaxID=29760 RepID=F6H9L0_VITVI